MLSWGACKGDAGHPVPTTWYPEDGLHTAEARAPSVAMTIQKKKEPGVYFFFLLKQRNFLETPLSILGDFAALHVHPLYTVHRIHTGQDA